MATDPPELTDATEQPTPEHRRPDGVTDATVEALGKLSEALEVVEDARGHLYGFHRLSGQADLTLGEAVDLMRDSGDDELAALADRLETELVGRNVVQGRWTFQVVEEYDDGYYADLKRLEADARQRLVGGRRHLFEAEMKQDRRTHGRRGHEASPDDGGTQSVAGARAADGGGQEAPTPGSAASTGDSQ